MCGPVDVCQIKRGLIKITEEYGITAGEPDKHVREHGVEGLDDALVIRWEELVEGKKLDHATVLLQSLGCGSEMFVCVQVGGSADHGLEWVGRDDVIFLISESQIVSAVIDDEAESWVVEYIIIESSKSGCNVLYFRFHFHAMESIKRILSQ